MSTSSEWVTVDLLDETPPPEQGPPRRPSGPRLGLVALAVVAVLAGLLLWPDSSSGPDAASESARPASNAPPVRQTVPDDPRLLPWPARGPWAGDPDFVGQAGAVWRASADPDQQPGDDVHVLWAGPVGTVAVALLQSVGEDGVPRVAQVTESVVPRSVNPGPLLLTSTAVVERQPPFVVVSYGGGLDLPGALDDPGTELLQVLPAPELSGDGVTLQRLQGTRFGRLVMQPDGLSEPWVYAPRLNPAGAVLMAVRTQGVDPGVLESGLITPDRILPDPTPVQVVPSSWGQLRRPLPEDYLDAYAALTSLDRTSGRVAVLGSTQTPDGRAALVEVRPRGPGRAVVVTVASGEGRPVVSEPRPSLAPDEIVLGAVRSLTGDVLAVAAGPPEATFLVLGADGAAVATGPRTTAVWLPREADVRQLSAQGYRDDETWVGRTTLDLGDL